MVRLNSDKKRKYKGSVEYNFISMSDKSIKGKYMKRAGRILLISTIIITLLTTILLSIVKAQKNRELTNSIQLDNSGKDIGDTGSIQIYVTGEVINPGIVEVERGATILEAVTACGGFTDKASLNINLVYSLDKNVTLIIKSKDNGGGASVLETAGDAIIVDSENGLIDGKININYADAGALGLLPGIGEKTAMDIINFRNSNGLFKCIEDIMNVPGIKESKYSKIKDYICIE